MALNFEFWSFDIVSDFDIRILVYANRTLIVPVKQFFYRCRGRLGVGFSAETEQTV